MKKSRASQTPALWPAFSRMAHPLYPTTEITFTRGKGAYLFDSKGNKYFDAFSTLWTNLVGHGREEIVDAMAKQSKKLSFMHVFSGSSHEPAIRLSEKLLKMSPFGHKHCMFGLSGSDATEAALKLARNYWYRKGKPNKNVIVGRKSTYHGTSYGALSLMGHDDYQRPFGPLVGGTHRVLPNDGAELERYFKQTNAKENIAAILIEPVITSDGLVVAPQEYWDKLKELCKKNDVLILCDEVSTGMGRTGELYGATHYGIQPDVVYLAKSLTSGYSPLSAIMTSGEIFEAIHSDGNFFMHGSTFAGHPVSCVAALKVAEIVEKEKLVSKAKKMGAFMESTFQKHLSGLECVDTINGKGTLFEITLKGIPDDKEVSVGMKLYTDLLKTGQYVRVLGKHLCIAPPLIAKESEIEKMTMSLAECLRKLKGKM